MSSDHEFLTKSRLSALKLAPKNISKIIQNLDPNEAFSFDKISIRVLKLRGSSISKPLSVISHDCLSTGQFLLLWKKGNIVPALVLIAGSKAGLAGLNLGNPENLALKPRKSS